MSDFILLTSVLAELRIIRDRQPHGEVRRLLNIAADRIDVSISKLAAEGKKDEAR
jgi:hypothetical protein